MKKTILVLFLSLFLGGSYQAKELASGNQSSSEGPIEDAINQIEAALSALEIQSDNWQEILQNLISTIESGLKADIQNILDRAISSTTEQALCMQDIRTLAIEGDLQNIISRLAGSQQNTVGPMICQASPASIQMALLTSNTSFSRTIHISGYNLDQGKYSIKLVDRVWNKKKARMVNKYKNISNENLTIQTPYHAVLNYQDAALTVSSIKIVIYHEDTRLIEIGIEQKTCDTNIKTSAEQTGTVADFRRTAGDKDFGWNNARFRVSVEVFITEDQQQVRARISVTVVETNGGDTQGRSVETVTLFTNTDPNFRIESITSGTNFSRDTFTNTSESGDSKNYADGGLVKRINFYGRSFGFDDLDKAKLNVHFNELSVRLIETGLCVTPQ